MADRAARLARQGLTDDAWSRFGRRGPVEGNVSEPGFKHNMTDLQAALGIHQLSRLDASIECRAEQWRRYDDALAPLPLTLTPSAGAGHPPCAPPLQVLVDRAARLSRDDLVATLRDRGVGTGVHYRAVHFHRYYRERYAIDPDSLPVGTDISERTLSLPLGPSVSPDDLAYVIATLRDELG